MIEFVKMQERDINEVVDFLNNNRIYRDPLKSQFHKMFLAKEKDEIFGIGIIDVKKDFALLKNIYIKMEKRKQNFGEGLVRTMLHYAYLKGVTRAYYPIQNNALDSFLKKLGFQEEQSHTINNDPMLKLNLTYFFSNKCHHGNS